jgi:hypothetical protein
MLTLSQAYRNYKKDTQNEGYSHDVSSGTALCAFLLILLFQIALAIFAMSRLISCSTLFPTWATILLAISFFIPDIGVFSSIGFITYYYVKCRG